MNENIFSQLMSLKAEPSRPPEPEKEYQVTVPQRLWPLVQLANVGAPISRAILTFIAHEPSEDKRLEYMAEIWQLSQMIMKKAVRQDRQTTPVPSGRRHHKKK